MVKFIESKKLTEAIPPQLIVPIVSAVLQLLGDKDIVNKILDIIGNVSGDNKEVIVNVLKVLSSGKAVSSLSGTIANKI